jgi:hypothetical protein
MSVGVNRFRGPGEVLEIEVLDGISFRVEEGGLSEVR